MVQDVEIRARIPATLWNRRRGQRVHGRLRRGLQPHPPTLRDRAQHRGRRSLWVGCGQNRSAVGDPGRRRARTPERFTTAADPKIIALPGTTWINKPLEKTKTDTEPATQKKLAA